ncbi:MAG: serine O-acetyltransferase EpsC [Candidatus Margulisiibacteriota bacterium]|jgi:serine O-acetyltransferase
MEKSKKLTMNNKEVTNKILESYQEIGVINHIENNKNSIPHPSKESIAKILINLKALLFPGFFENIDISFNNLEKITKIKVNFINHNLPSEIYKSCCWLCKKKDTCPDIEKCKNESKEITEKLLYYLPELRYLLKKDAASIYNGDPAAKSIEEIILAYPGFLAITTYRIANFLYKNEIPLIPRIMTEIAHNETGIDIHPGATIGENFCIDHGTGIVIGETAIIGSNVKLYQGVTIGALSVPDRKTVPKKRHPTIEDNVIIYAKTTILGGETIIGKNSIIGGNTWITSSVPANSLIYFKGEKQTHKIKHI